MKIVLYIIATLLLALLFRIEYLKSRKSINEVNEMIRKWDEEHIERLIRKQINEVKNDNKNV